MLRGEKEKKCLNDVRKILRTKPCFLCVDEDILKDIMTAKANEQENNFPDFVLENGFIEHFAVTTAKETAKGSSYRQKESDYQRTTEKECKELQEDWKKSEFHPNTITTVPHEFVFTENSYEYFVESFKRNFEKHLESLRRYNGQKDKGVFLIEQTDAMIFVDGTYPVCPYTLYQDKILLKYIYQFKDVLKYVIYTNGEIVDVVQLTLIPQLLLRIPEGIQFKVGRTVSTTLQCFIDLQI